MCVLILVLDEVFDTGLAALLDAFRTAGEVAGLLPGPQPRFEVVLAGLRGPVQSSQGFGIPAVALESCGTPDLVIVPAPGHKMPDALARALSSPDMAQAGAALRRWAQEGVQIAAPCIGAFVLAESGLLDGHAATCTWWLTPMFRERYPRVALDARRMVVSSGQFVTAGAALGHLDLALWLIRQRSPALAELVARYLIVDTRPSQSAYAITDHLAHDDALVTRFDRWAREHLAEPFSLDAAARAVAASKRTLARHLAHTLGKTPVEHVQDLRVELAVHLLRTSPDSVERIAQQVGYRDGVTLRALLRKRLGKGVRELRAS